MRSWEEQEETLLNFYTSFPLKRKTLKQNYKNGIVRIEIEATVTFLINIDPALSGFNL